MILIVNSNTIYLQLIAENPTTISSKMQLFQD